jgi:hypothetical protein
MSIGVLLACPLAWPTITIRPPGRAGPARVPRMAACLCPSILSAGWARRHRAPAIRDRPVMRPNGPGACLPRNFLSAPRLGELPVSLLPCARRGIQRGPRPRIGAPLTG